MTTLLAPEDTKEILAVLEAGGLLDEPTFTSVAIAKLSAEVRAKQSRSTNPRIAVREDLAMVAAHGDKALLSAWLDAARSRLEGNEALVARLAIVTKRVTGFDLALSWGPTAISELAARLAELYLTPADQRAFVTRAGLDAKSIAFDAKALVSWTAILRLAIDTGATDRLLDEALLQFPQDDVLLVRRAKTETKEEETDHALRARPRSEDRAVIVAPERPAAPAELPPGAPQRRRPIGG